MLMEKSLRMVWTQKYNVLKRSAIKGSLPHMQTAEWRAFKQRNGSRFASLWDAYRASGWERSYAPCVSRLNEAAGYTADNCFIETLAECWIRHKK